MRQLELLAPARDLQIGIAAIDCGADAVYIAGPRFGARQAAGNDIKDIEELCKYAHKFGANVFVTLNTILYDDELQEAYDFMQKCQKAGVDAIIVQDLAVVEMAKKGLNGSYTPLNIPLHASTQCAIRTPEQASFLESLGFSRLILERELSLEEIRQIRKAVKCELEFFVHGALCVCYSGQCYLSEKIAGRSANRGACIQACRSRYDLIDDSGKVLVKDKALLSLKDYNLKKRMEELADAGISSFKIEGRLKNESYVRNVVRDYSLELDRIISKRPSDYVRESFGSIWGGFSPNTSKTFNRGYTELFLDGHRGKWASMDSAKSMGEEIGMVVRLNKEKSSVSIHPLSDDIELNNGDGFSFVAKNGSVCGFRADICSGNTIRCKSVPELYIGARLFRNIDSAFEKEIERNPCVRKIQAQVRISAPSLEKIIAVALTEDGRESTFSLETGGQQADNQERMESMFRSQIGKSTGDFIFSVSEITHTDGLPFLSAGALNSIRRTLAEDLGQKNCFKRDIRGDDPVDSGFYCYGIKDISFKSNVSNHISEKVYKNCGAERVEKAYELTHIEDAELMRTKYCIKYELGLCPKHSGKVQRSKRLFLLNNGQKFTLEFDCANCEMIVKG